MCKNADNIIIVRNEKRTTLQNFTMYDIMYIIYFLTYVREK